MQHTVPMSFYLLLFVGLIFGNIGVYRTILAPRTLEVTALDVGEKGGATLVRAPNGATILIDTGPNANILRALGNALPPWQRKIDAIVLTSTKKAFVGGLPDVINRYKVLQQITLTESRRINFGDDTYIDISIMKNSPAGVYISDKGTVTRIR